MAVTVVRGASATGSPVAGVALRNTSSGSMSTIEVSASAEVEATSDAAVYDGHESQFHNSPNKIVTFEEADHTAAAVAQLVLANHELGRGAHSALTDQHARGHLAA